MEIVAVDAGGTHARFALARIEGGCVTHLEAAVTLKTADHASFHTAWEAFSSALDRPPPPALALAMAGPIEGEVLKLTNCPWTIRPALIRSDLRLDHLTLINDFAAVGHGVCAAGDEHLIHLCGPDVTLPRDGVISLVGPGTGLGVAGMLRRDGQVHVMGFEGGHVDFAPLDAIEDAILAHLRQRYRRVSTERMVSGPGLLNIYEALAALEGRPTLHHDDKALWASAIEGKDSLAAAALDRFCRILGSVAGDIVLIQGAGALVLAGGIAPRIAALLAQSGFSQRFTAKGRFETMMAGFPVKIATHPHLGLLGAAAAFAKEHKL